MTQTITAKLRHLRVAPRKVRAVAEIIKGLPVRDAEAQLLISSRRAGLPLLKLLRSAEANAKNNHKLEVDKLYIKEIKVDQGPRFKRWMPRARGAVSMIEKKTSHVSLILGFSEKLSPSKFVFKEKPKTKKTAKEKTEKEAKKEEQKKIVSEAKPVAKEGFFKKIFRRKSI